MNASPDPALLIAFVLGPSSSDSLRDQLQLHWGNLERCGTPVPFDRTDYYRSEMGDDLYRSVWGFRCLVPPQDIGEWKLRAIALEAEWKANNGRQWNIDVGYLDSDKLVLPSCKRGPHKLYWGQGLWLDMLMYYSKGSFYPHPWAFEDFVRNAYGRDLLLLREAYKKALKHWRAGTLDGTWTVLESSDL